MRRLACGIAIGLATTMLMPASWATEESATDRPDARISDGIGERTMSGEEVEESEQPAETEQVEGPGEAEEPEKGERPGDGEESGEGEDGPDSLASSRGGRPSGGRLTAVGRGYGHGRGMSQWGAYRAAKAGVPTRKILRFYYPGTSLATSTPKQLLRVRLLHDGSPILVRAERGLALWWTRRGGSIGNRVLPARHAGCRVGMWGVVRSGSDLVVRARSCGRWRTYMSSGRIQRGGRVSFVPKDDTFKLRRRAAGYDYSRREYRGALRTTIRDGELRAINYVGYEPYLRSVLPAETYASWPQSALRAQAVASRTYARWSANLRSTSYFDVYASTSSQQYLGIRSFNRHWRPVDRHEHPGSDRAIRNTARRILLFRGLPALTEYGPANGGRTANGAVPYAKAKRDRWDRRSGMYGRWTEKVSARRLEQWYPSIGQLRQVRLVSRSGGGKWGGRVTRVVLIGSKGRHTITGTTSVAIAFGLKSSWFTFR